MTNMHFTGDTHVSTKADQMQTDRQRDALHKYCLYLTRSRTDAEDLEQEVLAKTLASAQPDAAPYSDALLLRMARNAWIDGLRRRSAERRAYARLAPPSLAADSDRPAELEPVFHSLLRHLSPPQRAVFILRDVLDYSAKETARLLAISEGAVKAALHRARQALAAVREELAHDGGPAAPAGPDQRRLLRALAQAYAAGQVPVMLELLRQEPAAALAMTTAGQPALLQRPHRRALADTAGKGPACAFSRSGHTGFHMAA